MSKLCLHCGAPVDAEPWHAPSFCEKAPEVIIRAAIRTPDGSAWSIPVPGRHHDLIRRLAACSYGPEQLAEQGFRTNKRDFVDRREAFRIAQAAGQIKRKHGADNILFSEDLW